MDFFPLTLGVPKRRTPKREADAHPLDYDSWRESASLTEEFEPHAAEDVLMRLARDDPALPKRPWLILGEPMNMRILLASCIIVGAVAIITIGRTRAAT